MKKGASALLWVILLLGALFVTGYLKAPAQTQTAVTTSAPVQAAGISCQTDGTNELDVVVQDELSTTATAYIPVVVRTYGNDGLTTGSVTPGGGSSISYGAINIPCAPAKISGVVLVAGTGSTNSVRGTYDLSSKLADQMLLSSSNTTQLAFCVRNANDGTNVSVTCDTGNSANETAPVAMAANDVRTRRVDVIGVTGGRQFGSTDGGILISVDTADSSVFSDKAVSLSSSTLRLTEVQCSQYPRAISFNSANRCYKAPAIKTSDGYNFITVTISADLGNPGTSADPILYFDDIQSVEEDGKIIQDIYDKGGTSVGVSRNRVGFDNS